MSHTSIRINEVHKGIVGFDDSKLRREEEFEAFPREVVWMRPLAAQHVTLPPSRTKLVLERYICLFSLLS
jgi:hypothetical protein